MKTLEVPYVKELGSMLEYFCLDIYEIDEHPEIKRMISTVVNIKKDMECFIPEKLQE